MLLRHLPRHSILPGFLMLCVCTGAGAAPVRVEDVRLWSGPEGTRLVLDLSSPVKYDVFTLNNPYRVVVDLANASIADNSRLPAGQGSVMRVRSGKQPRQGLRFVLDLAVLQRPRSFIVGPDGRAGHRLVVELPAAAGAPAAPPPVTAATSPPPAVVPPAEPMSVKSVATG